MPTVYPCVPPRDRRPRHEVGSAVTKFKPGDLAGVGCLVDSDGTCPECRASFEQFCPSAVFTYNGPDKHLGGVTYGATPTAWSVDERFVLRVPRTSIPPGRRSCAPDHDLVAHAPASVTRGKKVGVVGLGGLGHMGVKLGRALGAHVVVFTTSPGRRRTRSASAPTRRRLPQRRQMRKHAGSFDFILDTVSAEHDVNAYVQLLPGTALTLVGAPDKPHAVSAFGLIFGTRASPARSSAASARPGDARLLRRPRHHRRRRAHPVQKIDEAYERLLRSDVKYRFSIDMPP